LELARHGEGGRAGGGRRKRARRAEGGDEGAAVSVPPLAFEKLKNVLLTVTTLARLKTLKASRMRRTRLCPTISLMSQYLAGVSLSLLNIVRRF
jgi:hypothetical protein